MAFLLSLEGDLASRLAPGAEVFSALGPPFLCTVPDLARTRSNMRAVG